LQDFSGFDGPWKRRALNGDGDALDQLVADSLEPLFRFCFYRLGRNHHLCEEVVQETLVRAITDLSHYEPQRSGNEVFPWLTGLARNEIRRALSDEPATASLESLWERMDEDLREILGRLESTRFDDKVLECVETREMVNVTMSQLPPRYRQALESK
jgi:RNA polymerase sigma factor (sigma-70 family)